MSTLNQASLTGFTSIHTYLSSFDGSLENRGVGVVPVEAGAQSVVEHGARRVGSGPLGGVPIADNCHGVLGGHFWGETGGSKHPEEFVCVLAALEGKE